MDSAGKRKIWNSAFILTSLCAQIATAVMATNPTNRGPSAHWNEDKINALLAYLLEHKSEIGDRGMFKMGTFNAAANSITSHYTLGPVKTGDMCKRKWRSVYTSYLFIFFIQACLCRLIFSSNQSTILFRSIKNRHQVFTGITLKERI